MIPVCYHHTSKCFCLYLGMCILLITGSALALHCCKAHAKINGKIENSTPCKIVTHEDFNLKLGTRDYVADATYYATLGSIYYNCQLVRLGIIAPALASTYLTYCDCHRRCLGLLCRRSARHLRGPHDRGHQISIIYRSTGSLGWWLSRWETPIDGHWTSRSTPTRRTKHLSFVDYFLIRLYFYMSILHSDKCSRKVNANLLTNCFEFIATLLSSQSV